MSSVDFHVMEVGHREMREIHKFTAEMDPDWELCIGATCAPVMDDEPREVLEKLAVTYRIWDIEQAANSETLKVFVIPFKGRLSEH